MSDSGDSFVFNKCERLREPVFSSSWKWLIFEERQSAEIPKYSRLHANTHTYSAFFCKMGRKRESGNHGKIWVHPRLKKLHSESKRNYVYRWMQKTAQMIKREKVQNLFCPHVIEKTSLMLLILRRKLKDLCMHSSHLLSCKRFAEEVKRICCNCCNIKESSLVSACSSFKVNGSSLEFHEILAFWTRNTWVPALHYKDKM